MSSSNSRKKNTRFYWAELGFIGLGLLGLNPNFIGDLLGGNSDSAKAVREAAQVIAKDALKQTKELTSHFTQGTQPAYGIQPAYGHGTYPSGAYPQNMYAAPNGYMPAPIVYGNHVYYPQQAYYPLHHQGQYPQVQQPAYTHQDSAAQFASFLSDFARRIAFDPSASQTNGTSQNGTSPGAASPPYQTNYDQNPWTTQTDSARYAQANTVPPNDYSGATTQPHVAQMPSSSGYKASTNMVQGYNSNYPSVSNSGTAQSNSQWATPQATGTSAYIPSTNSYSQQANNYSQQQDARVSAAGNNISSRNSPQYTGNNLYPSAPRTNSGYSTPSTQQNTPLQYQPNGGLIR